MDFWQWLVDLFTRMGEAQSNTVSQLTGVDFAGSNYIPDSSASVYAREDALSNNIGADSVLPSNDASAEPDAVSSALDNVTQGGSSLSSYIQENPGLSGEEYLKHMSSLSDEYAESYINYLLEKQSIDEANAYTASREDTAYQRLTEDLRKAGLNPAMMYGGSASVNASGSSGIVRMTEGANSRSISNYDKIKKLILAYLLYSLDKDKFTEKSIMDVFNYAMGGLSSLFG